MESVYGPFNRKNRREPDDGRVLPDRKVALKRDDAESSRKKKSGSGEAGKKPRRGEGAGLRTLFYNMLRNNHQGREGELDDQESRMAGLESSDLGLKRQASLQVGCSLVYLDFGH